jgi:hypothetical protein
MVFSMNITDGEAPTLDGPEPAIWRLISALARAEQIGLPPPARGGWCVLGVFVSQVLHACAIARYDLAEDALCEIAEGIPTEILPSFSDAFRAVSLAASGLRGAAEAV